MKIIDIYYKCLLFDLRRSEKSKVSLLRVNGYGKCTEFF